MDKQMLRTTITQLRQIALFAVGVSLLTACGNNQSGMKLGDNEFAVLAVNSTTSDQTTSYPATIRGTQDIEVRPQVSGFIVKLCVDEGATVRKGQALFQIDPTQYAAAVGQAKAAVEMAKANVATLTLTEKNKKALFDQKIISDFEYQTAVNQLMSAKASLAQAEASLVSANQNLSFCTVEWRCRYISVPYRKSGQPFCFAAVDNRIRNQRRVCLFFYDGERAAASDKSRGHFERTAGKDAGCPLAAV